MIDPVKLKAQIASLKIIRDEAEKLETKLRDIGLIKGHA